MMMLYKIPKGTPKDFFEIYMYFGHAPSEWFSSPGLEYYGRGASL
jgi:hypothetical protein